MVQHALAKKPLSLLILSSLLSACQTAPSNTVLPDLFSYSPEIQKQAATELKSFGPPCPRDTVIAGCSAVHRMVIDYGDDRNQIRAISAK